MIYIKPDINNLRKFLKDIRYEDGQELLYTYGVDFENVFIDTVLNKIPDSDIYFLSHNSNPLAIGGACLSDESKKSAQVWLLCSKHADKHKIYIYKHIKNRIEFFKTKYDFLYNYIYKSNYKALIWLKKCGFKDVDLDCSDFKFFYYSKGGYFDIRRFTRK